MQIEQEKRAENRTAALLHTLTERADTWGRKKLASASRESSSEAGRLINAKVKLLHEADAAHSRLVESAKSKVRQAMQQLQDQLCEELRKLAADKLAATDKIHAEFKPKLDEQEVKLEVAKIGVTDTVGKFTGDIQHLSLQQLEQVAAGKTVMCEVVHGGTGKHAFEFPVVCPDVEGP